MTFSRVLILMALLTAIALLHEAGARVDWSRDIPLSQVKHAVTVNGVPARQSLSGEVATGKDLLNYRLAPLPEWSASFSPPFSPAANLALLQSAVPMPHDSSSTRASAR